MKKQKLLLLAILFFVLSCTNVKKKDFYIVQDGVVLDSENITLKRKAFSIIAKEKDYFVIFAKELISSLKNKKKILKLLGTSAAWSANDFNAILYEPSDVLSHEDMCELYDEVKCEVYRSYKERLGFVDEPTYTFAVYPIEKNYQKFNKIDKKLMKDVPSGYYYIYIFNNIGRIDDVSNIQEVTIFRINISESNR